MPFSQTPLAAILLLAAVLGVGILVIVSVRRWLGPPAFREPTPEAGRPSDRSGSDGPSELPDRGDWESTLAAYKNLRDQGVLSEEEFRKIRTLVEPPRRIGTPDLRARHRLPTDPAGPEHERM